MKAYFLAAGFATRMYPLTRRMAKPLLEVAGLPILSHILDRTQSISELTEVVVIGNHRFAAPLEAWSRTVSCRVPLTLLDDGANDEDERLGAIGDLAFGLAEVPPNGEDLLVVAGDNLLGFDLSTLHGSFMEERKPLLVVRPVHPAVGPSPYNEVILDASGRVLQFREKPEVPASNLSAIALYFLTAGTEDLVREYLASGGNSDAPGHFISWLVGVRSVVARPIPGEWFDIGTVQLLEEAQERFRR